tara:strand:- start:2310 stop:2666 length:357 start_codon:yes stop_codon:yes gene_type:complete
MRSKDISINDIMSYMQGKEQHPIMHVRDSDDPKYKTIEKFVTDINPKTESYMSSVAGQMNKLMSTLRHMEPNDYNRIVNTFKKYNTEDMNGGGISGRGTYGFDKSRVDGRLIRRKRGN